MGVIIIVVTFYNKDVRSGRHFRENNNLKRRMFLGFYTFSHLKRPIQALNIFENVENGSSLVNVLLGKTLLGIFS